MTWIQNSHHWGVLLFAWPRGMALPLRPTLSSFLLGQHHIRLGPLHPASFLSIQKVYFSSTKWQYQVCCGHWRHDCASSINQPWMDGYTSLCPLWPLESFIFLCYNNQTGLLCPPSFIVSSLTVGFLWHYFNTSTPNIQHYVLFQTSTTEISSRFGMIVDRWS